MSGGYPKWLFYAIGLESFAIPSGGGGGIWMVEFDNHSPLGEGVGGRELGAHA